MLKRAHKNEIKDILQRNLINKYDNKKILDLQKLNEFECDYNSDDCKKWYFCNDSGVLQVYIQESGSAYKGIKLFINDLDKPNYERIECQNINFEYLKKRKECLKELNSLKSQLFLLLGDNDFKYSYDIGYIIKDFFVLTINTINCSITLKVKDKEFKNLSREKLLNFIKKNLNVINEKKKEIQKDYIYKLSLNQKPIKSIKNVSTVNETKKVKNRDKNEKSTLFINYNFKENYKVQSCKEFPEPNLI
jgi:hypothetical protein